MLNPQLLQFMMNLQAEEELKNEEKTNTTPPSHSSGKKYEFPTKLNYARVSVRID